MPNITGYDVFDVRFPTSLSADGSDAMNHDADYSAAYIVLRTEDPAVYGCGFTFTIGRGNEICAAAMELRARPWWASTSRISARTSGRPTAA